MASRLEALLLPCTRREFSSCCKFARDHFSLLKIPQQAGGAYLRDVVSCELHIKGISQVCLEYKKILKFASCFSQ